MLTNISVDTDLFRYLVTIHAVACCLVIYQFLLMGFRTNQRSTKEVKMALMVCIVMPIIQLPVSLARVLYSLRPEFQLQSPVDAYLDFIWSPMLTIVLIWLMQLYLAKSSGRLNKFHPANAVYAPISSVKVIGSLVFGYASSFVLWPTMSNLGYSLDIYTRILGLGALMFAMIEMAIHRYIERGLVSLTSYSWFWYIGTWTYFFKQVS